MGVEVTVGALAHTPGDVDIEGEGREFHVIDAEPMSAV
jgi:hypothetical protein